jgi:hypothetical protein
MGGKRMKNQLLKLRKAEGYIGIETMIIAALVIAAGFIALTTVLGDLNDYAVNSNGTLATWSYNPFVVGEN